MVKVKKKPGRFDGVYEKAAPEFFVAGFFEDWCSRTQVVKLGDVCKIELGGDAPGKRTADKKFDVIGSRLKPNPARRCGDSNVKEGTLFCIGKGDYAGTIAKTDSAAWLVKGGLSITVSNSEKLDPDFLALYFLAKDLYPLTRKIKKTEETEEKTEKAGDKKRPAVTVTRLKAFSIKLPPLEDQVLICKLHASSQNGTR